MPHAETPLLARFVFRDAWYSLLVRIAAAWQSFAMCTILYKALWKPRELGGYTGTGINPARTQPKNAQIISSPGGKARSNRSCDSKRRSFCKYPEIALVRRRNAA